MSAGGILGEFAQQGRVLHRQIRRTMCHPTRRKKALSLTLSENTSKGDGAFSCVFPISSSLIREPDLRAAFAHIRQFQFDLYQTHAARLSVPRIGALSGQRWVIAVLGCLFLSS